METLIERHCTGCGKTKPITEFAKDRHDPTGFTYRCKKCRAKWSANWAKANPEKVKASNLKNKDKRKLFYSSEEGRLSSKRSWLKKTYGMSIDDYNIMLEKQNHKCAICGSNNSFDKWKVMAVDHCHKTGKIRGLLCYKCNSGIGLLNDDPNIIKSAFKYLKKYESNVTV